MGSALQLNVHELQAGATQGHSVSENGGGRTIISLNDAEREHILGALREARWVLGGPNGAAARLAMKRTTLQSRMKKLGISRPQ
jgi:formate hydrogenlyase transcriptional activator